jgi:hypothetical protein
MVNASTDSNPTTSVLTSAGTIELPVVYEDGSLLGLLYAVDATTAQQLIATDLLRPLTLFGRALALVIAFEYRRTSIGAYNEFGIAILSKCRESRTSAWLALTSPHHVRTAGWFVVNLPVTTELALACGIETWGYPKYVSRITTDFASDEVRVELERELEIIQRSWRPIRLGAKPIVTLTMLRERILRTAMSPRYRMSFGGTGTTSLRIVGDGPTAATARRLELDRRRPLVTFRADELRSTLPAGEFVG